jgi:hypothetical protein
MAEEPDGAPDRLALVGQIETEHGAGATNDRQQAGAHPQHLVFPAPLGPRSSTISPGVDAQRRPGEYRELPQHRHGIVEVHDRLGHRRSRYGQTLR